MRQEDLNEMMRAPGERLVKKSPVLPVCPACSESYCGDGICLCTECSAKHRITNPADEVKS